MRWKLLSSTTFWLSLTLLLLQSHLEWTDDIDTGAIAPVQSLMTITKRHVSFDKLWLRWLWWPVILYLFWGMAHVCDIYFVSSIEVFSKRFKIPDDVAGATLMALGCNGPELSLNTIAIFQPSNIGVGAVIGGEVFNVLVIIGTALLATPEEYMPLQVGQYSFWRDIIFYVISVGLLYHALHDGIIDLWNVASLLSGGLVYILTVIFSSTFRRFFRRKKRELAHHKRMRSSQSESGVYSLLSECSDSPTADNTMACRMSPMLNPRTNQPDPQKVLYWNKASVCADPGSGTVLQIRADMRNRLMDLKSRSTPRYVVLLDSALMVSTLVDPRTYGQDMSHCASGMVKPKKDSETPWHHGGLVNRPRDFPPGRADSPSASTQNLLSKQNDMPSMFRASPWEVIPLEDIIWMDRPVDRKRFNLHLHMHNSESELASHLIPAEVEFRKQASKWAGSMKQACTQLGTEVSLGHFRASIHNFEPLLSAEAAEAIFKQMDTDQNGFIDGNECHLSLEDFRQTLSSTVPSLRNSFVDADRDNDHQLSQMEFANFGQMLDSKNSLGKYAIFFEDELDTDHDGKVSLPTLETLVEKKSSGDNDLLSADDLISYDLPAIMHGKCIFSALDAEIPPGIGDKVGQAFATALGSELSLKIEIVGVQEIAHPSGQGKEFDLLYTSKTASGATCIRKLHDEATQIEATVREAVRKVTAAGTSQAWCSSTLDFYGPKATKLPKGSKIKEVFGKLPAGH